MRMNFQNLVAVACVISPLFGCATATSKANEDLLGLFKDHNPPAFEDLVDHISEQSVKFAGAADNEDRKVEAVGWSLIGIALTAAGGLTYGASNDFLAGTALAGSAVALGDQFEHPGANSDAYAQAAKKLTCLVSASIPLENLGNPAKNAFLSNFISSPTPTQFLEAAQMEAGASNTSAAANVKAIVQNNKNIVPNTPLASAVFYENQQKRDVLLTAYNDVLSTLRDEIKHKSGDVDKMVKDLYGARKKYSDLRKEGDKLKAALDTADPTSPDSNAAFAQKILDIATYSSQLKSCVAVGSKNPES